MNESDATRSAARRTWISRVLCLLSLSAVMFCICVVAFAGKGWDAERVVASRYTTNLYRIYLKNTGPVKLKVYAEKGLSGTNDLSYQNVLVEVWKRGKWRPARQNPRQIYEDVIPDRFILLDPGEISMLMLRIPGDMYLLSRGQRVRIRVAAWREDRNFNYSRDTEWLLTKEFRWP